MTIVVAGCAALGVHLLYSHSTTRTTLWSRAHLTTHLASYRGRARSWLVHAGLDGARLRDVLLLVSCASLAGALVSVALFGAPVPALAGGALAAALPIEVLRHRRRARNVAAQEFWPKFIEEIRVLTSSAGRSIPQALFEAAASAPRELRSGFENARREWSISTDFARTVVVLERQLGDASADTICETLLVAHELGGANLDRRLADLAADRRLDLQYRKDARARQAGVRFARRFVLLVPLGMALAGMSVGDGRAAYGTAHGQLAVVAALAMMAVCWVWAGRLMQLPTEQRVFHER